MQVLWADPDPDYLSRIANYVRSTPRFNKLNIRYISELEQMSQHLQTGLRTDITLVCSTWISDLEFELKASTQCLIAIADSETELYKEGLSFVNKYQSVDDLFSKVYTLYAGALGDRSLFKDNANREQDTRIISVFSATGGCGKTTVAMNLAHLLSERQENVLYLSLESIPSTTAWLHGSEEAGFSQVLYYLRQEDAALEQQLKACIQKDEYTGVSFIAPHHSVREMQHMESADVRKLIAALQQLNQFSYIVMDLESCYHNRILESMAMSDAVLWLVLDDLHSTRKAKLWLTEANLNQPQQLERIRQAARFYTNKYTGAFRASEDQEDVLISGLLPYIPQWKNVRNREQQLSNRIFNDNLKQVVDVISGRSAV
ncbi:hypothetical protein SY83_17895 [Paenibacillus swuensis]|uniref:AAA domain-containing protein n=1 Tax=Paenibacillus swuensis TaxID=1178515 RepID=A0A172TM43_9BACL|nr:AAA family ATPase [Paenibacillus swuensis]ANE47853.1 hypothetical protein SY83_17895 [Paenibacillus swuensis]